VRVCVCVKGREGEGGGESKEKGRIFSRMSSNLADTIGVCPDPAAVAAATV
jgi:hypothetical protein